MEATLPIAISGSISLLSLVSLAFFAGRFSEKLAKLERELEGTVEAKFVEKDFQILRDKLTSNHDQLTQIQKDLKDVQRNIQRISNLQSGGSNAVFLQENAAGAGFTD